MRCKTTQAGFFQLRANKILHGSKRLRLFASCFLILGSYILSAQDVHFTQFFTNPIILNPAQTGYYDGNYRLGFNFKAQWPWAAPSLIYNHHTEAPYIDFSFGEKKLKTAWMGIGFNFLNDQAGDGRLTSRRFTLSYAYHQGFDKDLRYVLSIGVAGGYVIRSVDFTKFYYNSQWEDELGFNTTLGSGESFSRQSFGYFDLGAGLNLGMQVHDAVKLDFGFSLLHINRPKDNFYNAIERISFRYQANAGIGIKFSQSLSLTVNGYYSLQRTASEIIAGAMLGYGFSESNWGENDHTIYLGAYYRVKDAFAPVAGYQFKKTRLLLSYDVVLSKLIKPGRANGGPELSLVHVGKIGRDFNRKVYCPKF